jgi:hypothetical protein
MLGDEVSELSTVTALFVGVLHRGERLAPLGIFTTIPKEPVLVCGADDTLGAAASFGDAAPVRPGILKIEFGHMAGRTRDLTVCAKAFIEKECVTERDGAGVVSHAVGVVGREGGERRE